MIIGNLDGERHGQQINLTAEQLARRAKNHIKKEKARKRDEIRANHGFDDSQQTAECSECHEVVADVYPFKKIGEGNRFVKDVVVELCPGCLNRLSLGGVELSPVDTRQEISPRKPNQQVYQTGTKPKPLF